MQNSFSNYPIPKELLKFHMEGLYSTDPSMTQFEYFRVTYQPSKPRIPVSELVKKFKIFADANIPITRTESIDMSLKISKDGNENYTMQYRDNSKELRIRCDTEHGKPHVDIEWPGHPQDKSWLEKEPKNYDEAIDLYSHEGRRKQSSNRRHVLDYVSTPYTQRRKSRDAISTEKPICIRNSSFGYS